MIHTLHVEVFGDLDENAYFFVDDATNHGFLIDPGAEPEQFLKIIDEYDYKIEKILLTHGHFDHIGAVNGIQRALKIPVIMGAEGLKYAKNPAWNCSTLIGEEIILDDVTCLEDGTEINLEANPNFGVKLLAAPGHTSDGVIYYSAKESVAFVGDTIFPDSFGRVDLPGGSLYDLMETIKNVVLPLPDDTILLCGHGDSTTMFKERRRFV